MLRVAVRKPRGRRESFRRLLGWKDFRPSVWWWSDGDRVMMAKPLNDAQFLEAVQHQLSTGLTLSKKTITVDVVSDPN